MNPLAHGSIVFRLWFALSVIATVFTTIALGLYVWLAVVDNLDQQRIETHGKVQALLSSIGRFNLAGLSGTPNEREISAAEGLGIVRVDVLDEGGRPVQTVTFSGRATYASQAPSEDRLTMSREMSTVETVSFANGSYRVEGLTPDEIIGGGYFGEEHIVPMWKVFPGQPGFIRIVAEYPDLSAQTHTLISRCAFTALLIIFAVLVGMWPLLNRVVARPLKRYSALAMQIAVGQPARMPAHGDDELSQLGRAVNSMADALEYRATVDALTGLHNLRHLSSNLEGLIAEAGKTGTTLCVIVGDLDKFKPVNDGHGHQAGDRVLQAVGLAIKEWAGVSYPCWRLGGDEFVVALPNTSEAEALVRAASLRKTVNAVAVPMDGTLVRPSISVGVAVFPEDGDSAGELLGVADRRMYSAKAAQEAQMTQRALERTQAA